MRHLDIDLILSEEERLPCKFLHGAAGLGQLDPTDESGRSDLPIEAVIELPLWMAQSLKSNSMVDIVMPKHFGSKMRDELASSSGALNLRDYSFYFFDVGLKLCRAMEDSDLVRTLRTAFSGDRFRSLMAHSLTEWHDDVAEYTQNLTSSELRIFNEGLKASQDAVRWRVRRGGGVLETAKLLGKRNRS